MKHSLTLISALLLAVQITVYPQGIQKIKYQGYDVVKDELIIKFKRYPGFSSSSTGPASRSQILKNKNAVVKKIWSTGAEHWKISTDSIDALISELKSNPDVEYVQPNYAVYQSTSTNDTYFSSQWAVNGTTLADIGAMNAWNITKGDTSIVVGVIDCGIDYTHEDLKANIWINKNETPGNGIDDDHNGYIDDYYGWDFYNKDSNPMDDYHHGTHVAGIIGAKGNNNLGIAGVAWNVKLAALKILDNQGLGGQTKMAIDAIEYCINKGIKIINCSWGGTAYEPALYDEFSKANQAGVIVVAACGNSKTQGINNDVTPQYPASYDLPNIISVAANDANGNLASFSNYGKKSVDLSAPGVDIYSCAPYNTYMSLEGTSMAVPYVTGAIVLIKSVYPEKTNVEIINLLFSSVDKSSSMLNQTVTGGMLNLYKPISAASAASIKVSPAEINLGGVVINGGMPQQKLTIYNYSTEKVIIDSIRSGKGFLISNSSGIFSDIIVNTTIGANQSADILVKADPPEEKSYDTLITLRFSRGAAIWNKEVRCRMTAFSKGTLITSEDVSGKWTKEMSPFIVNSPLRVPAGQKLDIEPGVEVIFYNNAGISSSSQDAGAEYNIRAVGTKQDSIYFRPVDSSIPWSGFSFTGRGKYIFEYCNFLNASKSNNGLSEGAGGAIYCAGPDLRVVNSSFYGNQAAGHGGAIEFIGGDATVFIDSSRFTGNGSNDIPGGALVLRGKENWLLNSVFMDNKCSQGIVRIEGESADLNKAFVYNCSFQNNTSKTGGNMIDATSIKKILIKNCLGAMNNLSAGGGVINLNTISKGIISNCTLYDNSGSGTALKAEKVSDCMLENSILWDNFPYEINAPNDPYQTFAASYNSIKNYSGGDTNMSIPPDYADSLLYSLSNNSALKDKGNPLEIYNDMDGSRNDPGFKGGNPLAIYPAVIDFGKNGILSSVDKTVAVEDVNFYKDTVKVQSWNVSSGAFTISGMPDKMLPFKANEILISFNPQEIKKYSDTLYINTSLPSANKMKILLSGVCEDINCKGGIVTGELKNTGTGAYHVISDIIVPKGNRLTIDAGVELMFQPDTKFIVEGDLEIKGTPEEKVVFSSESDTSYAGIITLKGTNTKNILLENLIVRKMLGFNIESAANKVVFNNCEFSDNRNSKELDYFLLSKSSIAQFNSCKFTENSTQGPLIHSISGKLLLNNCLISRNTSMGAYLLLESNKTYIYNSSIFKNKSNSGIMTAMDLSAVAFTDTCKVINTIIADNVNASAKYQYEISLVSRNFLEPQENPNVKIYLELTNSCIKGGTEKLFTTLGSVKNSFYFNGADPVIADSYGNLSASSPCIDAGTNTYQGLTFSAADLAGNFRVWNMKIDVGAYEYGSKKYYAIPEKTILDYPKDLDTVSKDDTLRWKQVPGAWTYRLQISDTILFTRITYDFVVSNTLKKMSLDYGKKYYWRVAAINGQNQGPWSDVWSFKTFVARPASAPVLKNPSNNAVNQPLALTLQWRKCKDAEKYQVQVSTRFNFDSLLVDSTVADTVNQIAKLQSNTEYHWRVRALNQGGVGQYWSEEWTFTTIPPLPDVPVLVRPANDSTKDSVSLKLVWKVSKFADRYRLLVSEDDKFTKITFADSTRKDTLREVKELKEGMKYFWKVSAINPAGERYSGVWTFVTHLNAPDSLSVKDIINNRLMVSWKDRSNGETGFIVERKDLDLQQSDFAVLDTVGANVTSYTDSKVRLAAKYQYRIRSFTPFVQSAYLNPVSAVVSVEDEISQIPKDYSLLQNYPNPFNPVTVIKYGLPFESSVRLRIYNSLGEEVGEYINAVQRAGFHQISFNAGRISSGVYFYLLEARATDGSGSYRKVRKMLVVK